MGPLRRTHTLTPLVLQSADHRRVCDAYENGDKDVCRYCGVEASKGGLVGHLAGRNHKKRMALYHCDVCDVRVLSLINMQQHLRSKKHRVRMSTGRLRHSANCMHEVSHRCLAYEL